VGFVGGKIGRAANTGLALEVRARKTRGEDGGVPFVLDVSLEFPPGINIVFGPSGAGKSTLLDCIAGLLRPDEGRVAIGGDVLLDVGGGVNVPTEKRNFAYVFQNLALFPHMTVEQNVGYGLFRMAAAEKAACVAEMLRMFNAEKLAVRSASKLSGGERQRVALARSLATSPRVLLLDEPLTALDEELKKSIMDDLRAWSATQNIPIVYVTHSREEVDALGERVVLLSHGKVVGVGG
jgi:molybdate transport system ATP-binding protein